MNLVIDAGNTLVKLAVFNETGLIYKETCIKTAFKKHLEQMLEEFPAIKKAILSKVGSFSEANIVKMQKHFPLFILSAGSKIPFVNDYATPHTLGADRIALVSAAVKIHPGSNVLVIDTGSCITYDFLTSEGHYKGGAISPGISMRYKALNNFTEKLPLLDANLPKNITGNSTATSMHSGVINGVIFEIEGTIKHYEQDFTDLTVILTGGDMHFLRDSIKSSIFANPNFLLEGLNYLLEINQHT